MTQNIVSQITITEGTPFTVNITPPAITGVTWSISWTTQAGSAIPGTDFIPNSGTGFNITVQVPDDLIADDASKTFSIVGTIVANYAGSDGIDITETQPFEWDFTIDETPVGTGPLAGLEQLQPNLSVTEFQAANTLNQLLSIDAQLLIQQTSLSTLNQQQLAQVSLLALQGLKLAGSFAQLYLGTVQPIGAYGTMVKYVGRASNFIGLANSLQAQITDPSEQNFLKLEVSAFNLVANLAGYKGAEVAVAQQVSLGFSLMDLASSLSTAGANITTTNAEIDGVNQLIMKLTQAQTTLLQSQLDPYSVVISNGNAPSPTLTISPSSNVMTLTFQGASGKIDFIDNKGTVLSLQGPSGNGLAADAKGASLLPTPTDTINSNGNEYVLLISDSQTVVVAPTVSGNVIIDGSDATNSTIQFQGSMSSYSVSLFNNELVIQQGALSALVENANRIVFDDRIISFDASGDALVNPIGTPNLGHVYDVTSGPTAISGFNQNPFYDPLQGDKIFFTNATSAPSILNFIVAADVVSTYQDASNLADSLLQSYRYVVVTYDQGTSDVGSTTVQPAPGQDFLLIFADTLGNHQADAIVRLVGLDNASEISFTDLTSPVAGPTLTAAQINDDYLAVLQRSALRSEIISSQSEDALIGDTAAIGDIVALPEAQFNVYPVIQIIKLALSNYPTPAQLAGWVPFIEQNGLLQGQSQTNPLLDQMATAFVASDNFGKVYNSGTDVDPSSPVTAQEMQVIIQAATGIAATQNQINTWVATGLTIDQVFVDFALGDQYTAFAKVGVQQFLTSVADNAIGSQGSIVGSADASHPSILA